MAEEKDCERLREVGNCRSENSLIWAGFALTNFVTIVAIYSAFGIAVSILFQIASSLFLVAGVFFAVSWALYEAVGSKDKIKLTSPWALPFIGRKSRNEVEKFLPNPREIYIRQAENFNLSGTLVWSFGVLTLLFDLEMYVTLVIFLVALVISYWFTYPRYWSWREKK